MVMLPAKMLTSLAPSLRNAILAEVQRRLWKIIADRTGLGIHHFACAAIFCSVCTMKDYLSEEIQETSLYNQRHVLLHGNVLPFLILYSGWLYVWAFYLGLSEYVEAGFIGMAVIGVIQVLASLFCHWFVQVNCVMTCSKVHLYGLFDSSYFFQL